MRLVTKRSNNKRSNNKRSNNKRSNNKRSNNKRSNNKRITKRKINNNKKIEGGFKFNLFKKKKQDQNKKRFIEDIKEFYDYNIEFLFPYKDVEYDEKNRIHTDIVLKNIICFYIENNICKNKIVIDVKKIKYIAEEILTYIQIVLFDFDESEYIKYIEYKKSILNDKEPDFEEQTKVLKRQREIISKIINYVDVYENKDGNNHVQKVTNFKQQMYILKEIMINFFHDVCKIQIIDDVKNKFVEFFENILNINIGIRSDDTRNPYSNHYDSDSDIAEKAKKTEIFFLTEINFKEDEILAPNNTVDYVLGEANDDVHENS